MKTRSLLLLAFVLINMFMFAQKKGAEIKFDNIEHNYGDIRENGGKANHVFWFTNTGDDTLVLTRVQPGCGCTASDWTKTPLLPGQKGMVTAAYDPIGRPGVFKKSILVVSNAVSSPNISLFISGNVIPKPKDYTDTFRVYLGDLLFDRNNPVFHNMAAEEVRIDTVKFYNSSGKEMQISVKEAPAHISAVLSAGKIKPEGRGFLILTYNAREINTSGQRNDRVILQTTDAKQEVKMIFVTSTILEKQPEPTIEQKYPFKMGNLNMTRNSISFPEVLDTEKRTDSVIAYNSGDKAIEVKFKDIPKHLTPAISSQVIQPGKSATISVTYDGTQATGYGFMTNDRVFFETNDSLQPLKAIYVSANVREDFSKLTPKQLANAPKAVFDDKVFDFGTRPSGPDIPNSFVLTNAGKSDLIIRNVQASCGCTATKPEKTTLKPGETSKIDMTFNTQGRVGTQFKSITVVTNDPENGIVMLQVKGNLEKAE